MLSYCKPSRIDYIYQIINSGSMQHTKGLTLFKGLILIYFHGKIFPEAGEELWVWELPQLFASLGKIFLFIPLVCCMLFSTKYILINMSCYIAWPETRDLTNFRIYGSSHSHSLHHLAINLAWQSELMVCSYKYNLSPPDPLGRGQKPNVNL